MSRGTTHRSIRIPDDLWEAARKKAAAEGRTISDILRESLEQYVQEY